MFICARFINRIPLLLWDLIWVLAISPHMKQDGLCSICVLAYAIQSYFFAGFCEELVKYLTINRIWDSVLTNDWRTFVVYGICAGCGFATLENVLYVLSGGYATAIARAFTAVPFHCTLACISGIGIAKRRAFGTTMPWYKGISHVPPHTLLLTNPIISFIYQYLLSIFPRNACAILTLHYILYI